MPQKDTACRIAIMHTSFPTLITLSHTLVKLCLHLVTPCHTLPAAKLLAELPVSCVFPLVFGGVVYPFTGLNPKPSR